MKKKVALGLSGGVDSAVSAVLLLEAGYEVTGVFIECYRESGCRTDADRRDALEVAASLKIPFITLDFRKAYNQHVWQYFYAEYGAGRTPNPDVLCNREIKFGLFYDWAMEQDFDFVATGHYAKIAQLTKNCSKNNKDTEKSSFLVVPKDTWKDQTYFLNQIKKSELNTILFPLSDLKKEQVRALAEQHQLGVAHKKDSTGVCFVGEISVSDFLHQKLGEKEGLIKNRAGEILGRHQGVWFYTLGQRHGLQIASQNPETRPLFVIEKKMDTNELIVGFEEETATDNFVVQAMNWLVDDEEREKFLAGEIYVRLRHTGKLIRVKKMIQMTDSKTTQPITKTEISATTNSSSVQLATDNILEPITNYTKFQILLSESDKGLNSGQFAVFYTPYEGKMVCLGGGVIERN